MERHKAFFRIAVTIALSAALGCLLGCGSGTSNTTPATKSLAVADELNDRVLIYNAPFSTDESASVVLGEPGFTSWGRVPPTANSLNYPMGVAKDPAGNLYVSDFANNRVLQFQPPFTSGMNASVVFGESVFTSLDGLPFGPSSMIYPEAVAADSQGNLWVADSQDNRMLEFVPPFSNGMASALVLGQTSAGAGALCNQGGDAPTASTMCGPVGAAFDSSGNIWVADSGNNRVLEFVPPFSTGMAASVELGQPAATAFTSNLLNNGGVSANSLYGPSAAAFDPSGNLWVTDWLNDRVLEYVPPFSNGMAATTTISVCEPEGVSFDSSGELIVTDPYCNRILIFAPPFSNGMNATTVLGQPNFNDEARNQNYSSSEAFTLYNPVGIVTF